jgi:hypothetical protein
MVNVSEKVKHHTKIANYELLSDNRNQHRPRVHLYSLSPFIKQCSIRSQVAGDCFGLKKWNRVVDKGRERLKSYA